MRKMFHLKFLFGSIQFYIILHFLSNYQVNSEIVNIVDDCIEEESTRLLFKRQEMAIDLSTVLDGDVSEKTNNLAKIICEYIIPTVEPKELNGKLEEDDQEIADRPLHSETFHGFGNLRRTFESPTNVNWMDGDLSPGVIPNKLPDKVPDSTPGESQEIQDIGEIKEGDRITVTFNDISKNKLSDLPSEEEILHYKDECDEPGSKITKSDIQRIVTSIMHETPLRVLIQQKPKEQKKKLEKQILQQVKFKHQLLEPDAVVPRLLYQKGVGHFG